MILDCGMLQILNKDSAEDFNNIWQKIRQSKVLEVIPSRSCTAILITGYILFPPSPYQSGFILRRVTDYAYAKLFLDMIRGLIQSGISFATFELDRVLEYLTGDSYFVLLTVTTSILFNILGIQKDSTAC